MLAVSLVMLALKLTVAKVTYGTNDITHWQDFVNAVQRHGPIHVYSAPIPTSYYNHPPLMGYVLEAVNGLRNLGIPVRISIRAGASVGDLVSAMVVYALVRRRRGERAGIAAGVAVALSPVLFMISAFHGNTDPVFTMLLVLALYLLVDRNSPAWAGAVVALAVGVKIVAIVAVPVLVVYALRRGRRVALRFAAAGLVVFAATWGPALLLESAQVKQHVLNYPGLGTAQWGLIQFGHWAGDPGWVAWARGSGREWIVALCAVIPAIAVWRRPTVVVTAAGLSLTAFMLLTPAFAMQYLAWAAVATYLVNFWGGVAYNVLAGLLQLHVYDRWSGNRFFATFKGDAHFQVNTPGEVVFGMLAWGVLVVTCWSGLRQIWQREPAPPASIPAQSSNGDAPVQNETPRDHVTAQLSQ